ALQIGAAFAELPQRFEREIDARGKAVGRTAAKPQIASDSARQRRESITSRGGRHEAGEGERGAGFLDGEGEIGNAGWLESRGAAEGGKHCGRGRGDFGAGGGAGERYRLAIDGGFPLLQREQGFQQFQCVSGE